MPHDASALERDPYDRVLFLGDPHIGKADPLSEPVLTPSGWRPMGALCENDFVIGSDGRPTRITAVYPQGVKPIVRVTMDCGATTRCCLEHLWFTTTRHELKRGAWKYPPGTPHPMRKGMAREFVGWGEGSVKTTQELIETLAARHYLPRLSGPARFDVPATLALDPYFLGLLLGDGSCVEGSQITLSKPDEDVLSVFERGVRETGDMPVRMDMGARCPRVRVNGTKLRETLKGLGLWDRRAAEKIVPEAYLRAAPDQRLALLRGLCDTDGHAMQMRTDYNPDHAHNGMSVSAEFCTTAPGLRDAVVELVRSLGGRALVRYKPEPMSQAGPGQPAWLVNIAFDDGTCPFLLPRKAAFWVGADREKFYRQRLESIEPAGEEECACITVEAADGLFVVNDYIITHNSTSIVASAADAFGLGYVLNCGKSTGLLDASRRSKKFKYDIIRDEAQMEEALKEARRGAKDGTYKWIVIDDFNLYASWLEGALEDQTRNKAGEADGRRFWREYRKRLINILVRCFDFKAHVYVISHYMETGGGLIDGQTEKTGHGIAPLFGGAARKEIPGMFGNVVFMAPDVAHRTRRCFYINPVGVFGPTCLDLPGTHALEADVGILHAEFERVGKQDAGQRNTSSSSSNKRK